VFFGFNFAISLSVISTKRLVAILFLYPPGGDYKGISRQVLPITTSDFLYSLV
jgi:hypothetical protein